MDTKVLKLIHMHNACFGHLHIYKIQKLDTLKSSNIFIKLSEPNCRCNYSHKNQRLKKKIYIYIYICYYNKNVLIFDWMIY